MADAVITTVTTAVTAALAGASFSQMFIPERSYADWANPLETESASDENQLLVDVVGHMTEQKLEAATRGTEPKIKYLIAVDVAVRKRFGQDKQNSTTGRVKIEEVDALVFLVQEIHEFFFLQRNPELAAAVWDKPAVVLVNPDREHLRKMKQFTGIVRLSFAAFKTPGDV